MNATLEALSDSGQLQNLPAISTARLPETYRAAQKALSECSKIDECQAWADKAEALASYAKQSKDESLRKMADRIQARAIRRCGELLKQIPNGAGRPAKIQEGDLPNYPQRSRTEVATDAGLSEHQRKTALRVASVPESEFTAAVESESPPTVTQLAEQGKKTLLDLGESKPRDFALATQAIATLRRFSEFCSAHDPAQVAAGVQPSEAARVRAHVQSIDSWLDQFITRIEV